MRFGLVPGTGAAAGGRTGFSSWNQPWLWGVFLVAITVTAYLPVWHAGFIWDDDKFLLENPLIRMPDGLYRFWFTASSPDYFPATSSTLWFEWRLWGKNPLGYHLVNLFLHALSSLLWWRVLVRLKIPGAWLAAALFAVHPVNVESVAWITERKNTLAMFFFVLTLLWYLRFKDTGRRLWYCVAAGAFVLALLSKTAVAPLPFMLLGLAWWRQGKVERRDLLHSIPFFGVATVMALITVWFQYHLSIGSEIVRDDSFFSRLAGAGWAVWFYLYKAVIPLNLLFVYPRWKIDAANLLSYVPVFLATMVFLVCFHYRRRWGKAWLSGLGYFVVMLLPVLGFLNIYFMRYSMVADHWQYFSIIGPIALIAAGITIGLRSFGERKPLLAPVICGILLIMLGGLTWRQCGMYTDVEMLWRTTLAGNPDSPMVYNNLGGILLEKGQTHEAITHFQKALEIEPEHVNAHNNLGNALRQMGRADEAIVHFERALEIQPDHAKAHNNLGSVLRQMGRVDEAIVHFERALEIQPGFVNAHNNLAFTLHQKGMLDEAIAHFQRSLELQPDDAGACNNLANILIQRGRVSEAIALAQQADRLSGGMNPVIIGTLAAAYAAAGRFSEAVTAARQALQLASAQSNIALANSLRAQIGLYETGLTSSGPGRYE